MLQFMEELEEKNLMLIKLLEEEESDAAKLKQQQEDRENIIRDQIKDTEKTIQIFERRLIDEGQRNCDVNSSIKNDLEENIYYGIKESNKFNILV